MKKLVLKASAFKNAEVLTRSQLKKVLGGDGSGWGSGSGTGRCLANVVTCWYDAYSVNHIF